MDDNAGKAMPDIFISYARKDRETAERLARALEAEGWSVWWDRHIPAGKRFDEVISASLDGAKCVIALWSNAAIASQWVAEEAEEGKERGVLVPALIEAVEPPLGFRRIHAADLVGWRGNDDHAGLRQLIGDVCQVMSTATVATDASPSGSTPVSSRSSRSAMPPASRRWRLPLLVGAGALVAVIGIVVGWSTVQSPPGTTSSRKITVEYQSGGADANVNANLSPLKTALDGHWQGQVTYDWGLVQDETFSFRTHGHTLTGSAGFLGVARAILDPRLDGDELRFDVRWQETLGSGERDVINHYQGVIGGDRIDMVLTIDGGFLPHPPIDFVLTRAPN